MELSQVPIRGWPWGTAFTHNFLRYLNDQKNMEDFIRDNPIDQVVYQGRVRGRQALCWRVVVNLEGGEGNLCTVVDGGPLAGVTKAGIKWPRTE